MGGRKWKTIDIAADETGKRRRRKDKKVRNATRSARHHTKETCIDGAEKSDRPVDKERPFEDILFLSFFPLHSKDLLRVLSFKTRALQRICRGIER